MGEGCVVVDGDWGGGVGGVSDTLLCLHGIGSIVAVILCPIHYLASIQHQGKSLRRTCRPEPEDMHLSGYTDPASRCLQ